MPLNEKPILKRISSAIPSTQSDGPKKRKFDSNTVQFFYNRYVSDDAQKIAEYEDVVLNAEIVRSIHKLRTKAGLSQRELLQVAAKRTDR